MDALDRVPCIQVNATNIDECWSVLTKAIEQSHFVALDLELSGLGDKKKLILKDIEDRYQAISEVAKTRSILSVGLSFFRYNHRGTDPQSDSLGEEQLNEWAFKVTIFELLTLCKEDTVLEDESRSFLVSHGFDFDLQQSSGLPYLRAYQDMDADSASIRGLFKLLIAKKVPLVFHNGLLDLVFIYQHFFAPLPPKLASFVADLDVLFPKGIFDTKYIAEHGLSPGGSYLEYLFYQRQRHNLEKQVTSQSFMSVHFNSADSAFVIHRPMKSKILGEKPDGLRICNDYRQHGWCKDGSECKRSHDIDFILDDEDTYKKPSSSRKRLLTKMNVLNSPHPTSTEAQAKSHSEPSEHINGQVKSSIHRSGYDAFMTGFCMATFIMQLSRPKPGKSGRLNFSTSDIKRMTNRIFLTGKKDPLIIRFSEYSKPTSWATKMVAQSLRSERND